MQGSPAGERICFGRVEIAATGGSASDVALGYSFLSSLASVDQGTTLILLSLMKSGSGPGALSPLCVPITRFPNSILFSTSQDRRSLRSS